MIKRPTVFVIGAGAGVDFDMPMGRQLADRMAKMALLNDSVLYQHLDLGLEFLSITEEFKHIGHRSLQHTAQTIARAMPSAPSIDNFLETHRGDVELEMVGKMAIATALLQSERDSWLATKNPIISKSWLMLLFQLMVAGSDRDDVAAAFANVSFINFNYDRCLEYFLIDNLQLYYKGLSRIEAEAIVRGVNIIHPYGWLGRLWPEGHLHPVAFGEELGARRGIITGRQLVEFANSVRTLSQYRSEIGDREKIALWLEQADRVFFLGFAFHQLNVDLLANGTKSQRQRVYRGTAYDESEGNRYEFLQHIRSILPVFGPMPPNEINKLTTKGCKELIADEWQLLQAR